MDENQIRKEIGIDPKDDSVVGQPQQSTDVPAGDIATVVSILPFAVQESKPGLAPGDFFIPPGSPDKPRFFIVTKAQIRMMDQDFRPFMMDIPKFDVAKDVANSYAVAQIGFSPESKPGLIAVPGKITSLTQLKKDFNRQYTEAVLHQRNWFEVLVKMADDDWARMPQHKHINDLQRTAARTLNLEREWLLEEIHMNAKCPACMSTVSKEAAVCFACKAVLNEDKYKAIKFAS